MLAGGLAAAGTTWMAPSIIGLDRAAAARSSHVGRCETPRLEGQAEWLSSDPANTVVGGPLQSAKTSYVWMEQGPCELEDDLLVNRKTAGNWYGDNFGEKAFIEKGTCVCSYFVHGDHIEISEFVAALHFTSSTILGIIYRNSELVSSSFLEAPGTAYTYYKMDAKDEMSFNGSTTLKWNMVYDEPKDPDQMRVIVSCGKGDSDGGEK